MYCKNNGAQPAKVENILLVPENHVDKKTEAKSEHCVTANGKNAIQVNLKSIIKYIH